MPRILFYDTLWGAPLPTDLPLPQGVEITTDRRTYADANAVVFHIPRWKWKPRWLFPKKLPGQLWVAMSMECEENYPRLKNPSFLRAFDLTMTYRYDSHIPIPYFNYYSSANEFLDALRAPPFPKTAPVPAASFISSRINTSGRRGYVAELMQHLPTHSYGKFRNNIRLADDGGRPSKIRAIAPYKFTLAFENAISRDYVTEKFFDPLMIGSVPVYLGAPNVDEHIPGDHCYINVNDFPTPRALAAYLLHLANDDADYNTYLEWKTKPLQAAFVERVRQYTPHFALRLAQYLHSYTTLSPLSLWERGGRGG